MVTNLGRASLSKYLKHPGIVVLNWTHRARDPSPELDRSFKETAAANPSIHFASVDLGRHPGLSREWAIDQTPSLMVFREGVLLYRHSGTMFEGELEAVLRAAAAVDMNEVRQRINGYRGRRALEQADALWFQEWVRSQQDRADDGHPRKSTAN